MLLVEKQYPKYTSRLKLSDKNIRDISRLLEKGKPLPDKYCFMLFGDDREIELVWNGTTGAVTIHEIA
jgi:hypothetical protein